MDDTTGTCYGCNLRDALGGCLAYGPCTGNSQQHDPTPATNAPPRAPAEPPKRLVARAPSAGRAERAEATNALLRDVVEAAKAKNMRCPNNREKCWELYPSAECEPLCMALAALKEADR